MKRVLLDEPVPCRLGFALEGHFVRTVQFMGWSGMKNGQFLRLAASQFAPYHQTPKHPVQRLPDIASDA
jgi:hypothetical protein